MCGESNAGKSALVLRFSGNQFTHSFTSTIGVDFRNEQVMVEGQQVQLQIWDTAGQERFDSITSSFFSRADGVVLCYDCTCASSFSKVQHWYAQLAERKEVGVDISVVLACTKCDLPLESWATPEAEGKALAASLSVPFALTSSKSGLNVRDLFLAVAADAVSRKCGRDLRRTQQASEPSGGDGPSAQVQKPLRAVGAPRFAADEGGGCC